MVLSVAVHECPEPWRILVVHHVEIPLKLHDHPQGSNQSFLRVGDEKGKRPGVWNKYIKEIMKGLPVILALALVQKLVNKGCVVLSGHEVGEHRSEGVGGPNDCGLHEGVVAGPVHTGCALQEQPLSLTLGQVLKSSPKLN